MRASPIALVTGGNRGIGLEVCRQLAQNRMRVLLGVRDPAKGEKAAREMAHGGLDVEAVALDVTDAASIRALGDQLGAVDVLINNAGVDYDTDQTVVSADLARVQRLFETNLFGAWAMARAVAPGMRRRRWGRIVNVSSSAGSLADMGRGPPGYSASKAALNALTRLLAGSSPEPAYWSTAFVRAGSRPTWAAAAGGWCTTARRASSGRATLPDDGPTGGFFRDGRPLPW